MSIENKYRQTIAIVYPAVPPCNAYVLPIDREINTHVTVSILGEIPDVSFSKKELISALNEIPWENIKETSVEGLALFGPEGEFLVMEVDSPALHENRNRVKETLSSLGIASTDKYPDYRPHITLMHDYEGELPAPEVMPSAVEVGAPTLWWGTEVIPLG